MAAAMTGRYEDEGRRSKGHHGRDRDRDNRRRSRSASPRRRRSRSPRTRRASPDYEPSRRYRSHSRDRRKRSRSPQSQAVTRNGRESRADGALQRYDAEQSGPPEEKQRPNFGVSGKLAAETNTVSGTDIVLKYHEPPEARKPPASQAWRLYVFKGKDTVDERELYVRSCWLFGRERVIADYHMDHPSISKQHAVIQFRHIEKKNEFGDRIGSVKPYLIDLDSSNGTQVNGKDIPPSRYYELRSGDVVMFGESSREYVVMLPPKG